MKSKENPRFISRAISCALALVLLAAALSCLIGLPAKAVGAVTAPAAEAGTIDSAFSSYRVQSTRRVDDGGYVGEVQYTIYYDASKGGSTVKTGYKSQNAVVIYAVNTKMPRVGTDSDTTIVRSMLDRGFVVVVLDYLNNEKAISPALDYSAQYFRTDIATGKYMPDNTGAFPNITVNNSANKYPENFLVPAGCNLIYSDVFWEIDKHGVDGTLEKIVEKWNTDFKGKHPDKLVKWATGSTTSTRKKVQSYTRLNTETQTQETTTPVWYNASGQESSSGLYTKVKWTVAEKIEDCVNPDGSPIDFNMYIHTVYPTKPESEVPVVSLANSSNYPTSMKTSDDPRAQFNGFLFRGYASAVFDYLWYPMAQNQSFGYYDGNLNGKPQEALPTVTTDHMNYSLQLYNDKLLNTAAMRYLRYLSLSGGNTYNFDVENFGVVGNSKGGWFTFLGEKVLQSELVDKNAYSTTAALENAIDMKLASFTPKRYLPGHHGETRYQAGNTADKVANGMTVDGGEKQPWLTYEGKEILSGCQLVYASNGSQEEDFSSGHAPTFVALHIFDTYNAAYGSANLFSNLCRNHDIPSMIFEVPLGHMLAYGEDMDYGVDTYLAFFDFAEYHLRDGAVKVVYVTPLANDGNIPTDTSITVKFSGPVDLENVKKVTVSDSRACALNGVWTSEFGNTEWTFTPSEFLLPDESYTVTVPSSLKGDNGKEMGNTYRSGFTTENCIGISATRLEDNRTSFTVPALPKDGRGYVLRFYVANDAANVAAVYTTDGLFGEDDELLGKVNLRGAGVYELDVSDYLRDKVGERVYFHIVENKLAGSFERYSADFSKTLNGNSVGKYAKGGVEDGKLKITVKDNKGRYKGADGIDYFYENNTSVLSNSTLINGGAKLTDADYGRRFTISFSIYDEVSRVLQVKLNSCSSSTNKTIDYDHVVYNVYTKAGEWVEYTIEYQVYEPSYGSAMGYNKKTFSICAAPTGNSEKPFYLDDLKVTETLTEITVGAAQLYATVGNSHPDKTDSSAAVTLVDASGSTRNFSTLGSALKSYKTGDTLKLGKNYKISASDVVNLTTKVEVNAYILDLCGYTLISDDASPLTAKITADSVTALNITLKNGKVLLKDKSIISFKGSVKKSGLNYRLDLVGVDIELLDGAKLTELITDVKDSPDATLSLKVTLTDCNLDVREERFNGSYLTVFPVSLGSDGLVANEPAFAVNYTVSGGSVSFTKVKTVRLTADPSSLLFKKTDGAYTEITLPSSVRVSPPTVPKGFIWFPPLDATYENADGTAELCSFVGYKRDGGITAYAPAPKSVADNVKSYPFIVFDEIGGYIGGYASLLTNSGAVNAAKGYLAGNAYDATLKTYGENAKSAYAVMRRDYELASDEVYDNYAQIHNEFTVDLAGYTLTTAKGGRLFAYDAKMWSGALGAKIFPTKIRLVGGDIVSRGSELLYLTAWEYDASSSVAGKESSFVFENVNFTFTESGSSFVAFGTKTPTAATKFEFELNSCTFDLTRAPSGFTLFNASHELWSTSYEASGVRVLAKSAGSVTLTNINTGATAQNSVVFGKDIYGESFTAVFADGGVPDANAKYTILGGQSVGFTKTALGEYKICAHVYAFPCATKCVICQTARPSGEIGNHDHSILKWSESEHWYECACGDKTTVEAHLGGTPSCKAKQSCSVCDELYGELTPHAWGEWQSNDQTHNRKCEVCRMSEGAAEHSYEYVTTVEPTAKTEGERVGTCICGHTVTETVPLLEDGGANLGLIIGLSVGGAVLLGGGITVFILIRRKRKIG